jgi:hypothetical protein
MLATLTSREVHRIPVLLGGSGRAGTPPVRHCKLPVLLRPLPCCGKCRGRPLIGCPVAG